MIDRATKKKNIKICAECNANVTTNYRKNRCNTCYCRYQRRLRQEQSPKIPCACGCGEMIYSINQMGKPAQYKQNHGQKGSNHPMWKGGRIYDDDGYVLNWTPHHPNCNNDGYVREHRLVMEKHLGRYLTKEEVVHHINGIKDDNRIENLELLENQALHTQIHMTGTSYAKKDMSGRVCMKCGNTNTHLDKNGWYHWYTYEDEFICHNCYSKKQNDLKKTFLN